MDSDRDRNYAKTIVNMPIVLISKVSMYFNLLTTFFTTSPQIYSQMQHIYQ